NLHTLTGPPVAHLAQAVDAFEEGFTYPLGPGRTFRISHGDDYPRFFRSMGRAAVFVAEREGEVLGVLAVALRRLLLPDGQERTVAYLGDVKVAPSARRSTVFFRLAGAAREWAGADASAAFGVVMDGTPVTPDRYTGRLGLPRFEVLGKVLVWRLSCAD